MLMLRKVLLTSFALVLEGCFFDDFHSFQLTSALSNSKAISIPVLEFQSIKGLTGLIRHSQGKQDMRECEVTRAYTQSGQIPVPQRCAGSANESHNNPIHVIVGFFEAFSQPGLQPHAISAPTDLWS